MQARPLEDPTRLHVVFEAKMLDDLTDLAIKRRLSRAELIRRILEKEIKLSKLKKAACE